MNNAYEDIMDMTDEEAVKVLENIRLMVLNGRKNGKVMLELSYNVALQKAIQALKLNANLPSLIATAMEKKTTDEEVIRELWNCRNELCLRCGKYEKAYCGACDDCRYNAENMKRWRKDSE